MSWQNNNWAASQQGEPEKSNEQYLLQRIISGDTSASWELLSRHADLLYLCCLRVLDGHTEDARDALSLIYLKAHHELPLHGHNIRNPGAWLIRFAQNLCLDLRRKRVADQKLVHSMTLIESISPRRPLPPERILLERELNAAIHTAIESLPPRLREAAQLRFVENCPYLEIAQQLAITQVNARKRIQEARNILTHMLGRYLAPGECS